MPLISSTVSRDLSFHALRLEEGESEREAEREEDGERAREMPQHNGATREKPHFGLF